jgi:hypothetical protein
VQVQDPYWEDVSNFAYQELQPHQDAAIKAAEHNLQALRQAVLCSGRQPGAVTSSISSSSSSSGSKVKRAADDAGVLISGKGAQAGQSALNGC